MYFITFRTTIYFAPGNYLILIEHCCYNIHTTESSLYGYSLKNIPTPNKTLYLVKLTEKMEILVKRMRWKAHLFLNENAQSTQWET